MAAFEMGDLHRRLVVAGLPPLTSEEEVELWATASSILTIISDSWRGADPGNKIWGLFHFVALGISSAFEGAPPKAWRTRKGGRTQSELVRSAKRFAAAYVRLSKEGLIPDKEYNKTVRGLFGVDATAVQQWARLDCSDEYELLRSTIGDPPGIPAHRLMEAHHKLSLYILGNAAKQYRRGGF